MPFRIAEAHSHLALGNVALAIESFRKALREQPDSVDAMAGLAACYDEMARFDLSRRYYEAALAVTPADTRLLNAFARSLDRQGHLEEAAEVRREIGVRLAAAKPSAPPTVKLQPAPASRAVASQQLAAKTHAPVAGPSVTITLPPPRPIAAAERSNEPKPTAAAPAASPAVMADLPSTKPIAAVAAPRPAKTPPPASAATAVPPLPSVRPVAVAAAGRPAPTRPVDPTPAAIVAAPAPAVVAAAPPPPPAATVAAPAPTRMAALAPAPTVMGLAPAVPTTVAPVSAAPLIAALAPVAPPPAPAPIIVSTEVMAQRMPTVSGAPRLERISPGEVALVTTGRPQWRSTIVARTAHTTTVRYVPLRAAAARPVRIRLLNAARHQGLAARTRTLLAQRGWRQLAIGDARHVRQTSLILYPAHRRATAVRLGRQFGIPIAKRASGGEFVMLLGRDAAKLRAVRG